MTTGVRIGLATVMALAVLGWASARPTAAQADELQVSLDGQRWFSRIDRPLFGADRRWVPGDTETVTVWARNTSTDAAGLTIRLVDGDLGSRLNDELRLSATANGQPLSTTAGYPVGPGDPVRVDITLTFPTGVGNAGQRRTVDVTLRLTLTRLIVAEPPTIEAPIPPRSEPGLPNTGAPPLAGVLLVAGPLLLSAGAAALGGHRRSRPSRGER